MAIITLFHGSPYESVTPEYGLGNDKHDYGRGFYLTANVELAKEWAVCRPDESNGWVHQYELDTNGLRILDFQEYSVLTWLAELMKHRDAPIPSAIACWLRSSSPNMALTPAAMTSSKAGVRTPRILYRQRIRPRQCGRRYLGGTAVAWRSGHPVLRQDRKGVQATARSPGRPAFRQLQRIQRQIQSEGC